MSSQLQESIKLLPLTVLKKELSDFNKSVKISGYSKLNRDGIEKLILKHADKFQHLISKAKEHKKEKVVKPTEVKKPKEKKVVEKPKEEVNVWEMANEYKNIFEIYDFKIINENLYKITNKKFNEQLFKDISYRVSIFESLVKNNQINDFIKLMKQEIKKVEKPKEEVEKTKEEAIKEFYNIFESNNVDDIYKNVQIIYDDSLEAKKTDFYKKLKYIHRENHEWIENKKYQNIILKQLLTINKLIEFLELFKEDEEFNKAWEIENEKRNKALLMQRKQEEMIKKEVKNKEDEEIIKKLNKVLSEKTEKDDLAKFLKGKININYINSHGKEKK